MNFYLIKKRLVLIVLMLLASYSFAQKGQPDLVKVALINNNGDTVFVESKASYYNEYSFNSFGYYNQDGSRGRANANEYVKIIIGDKYLESVKLKSTVKKDCDKQVFLERLIDGPMIMYLFHYVKTGYQFSTKCIEEIYIRKADEECAYPLYKEACSNTVALVGQPKNENDIIALFVDAPEIIEKIESGEYHREDFEKMVLEYNDLMENK